MILIQKMDEADASFVVRGDDGGGGRPRHGRGRDE